MRKLYCIGNLLTSFPSLEQCQQLQELSCGNNKFRVRAFGSASGKGSSLPLLRTSLPSLKKCQQLYDLSCMKNQLTSLPSLKECKQLEFYCNNNFISLSEIPSKFIIKYNKQQYYINYLVTKITLELAN